MNKQEQVQQMTTYMANFVSHIAKVLPDDIIAKLDELGAQEDAPLSKVIYETMKRNQKLAKELNRPSCQDTGVLQFWVKCGVNFPLIGEVEGLLKEAVVKSTFEAPLRHNSVETFDEFNTGRNVGKGTPTVWWDIIPNSDKCEIDLVLVARLEIRTGRRGAGEIAGHLILVQCAARSTVIAAVLVLLVVQAGFTGVRHWLLPRRPWLRPLPVRPAS